MIPRQRIVDQARSWIGTPWKHQQFARGVATDCRGLIGGVALALGLPGATDWRDNPDYHNYGRQPDPKVLIAGCDLFMDRIHVDDVLPGDVLVMSFIRDPQHFGFVSALDPMYLIHAYARAGQVVENRVDEKWRSRIKRAYKLRGVG